MHDLTRGAGLQGGEQATGAGDTLHYRQRVQGPGGGPEWLLTPGTESSVC